MVTNILTYLTRAWKQTPEKIVLSDAHGAMTYDQLYTAACNGGTALAQALSGARNQPVFVCIDRRLESIAAFLAVAASGNFYVPIDPNLPDKRLLDIFYTMNPAAVLTTGATKKPLPFAGTPLLDWQSLSAQPGDPGLIDGQCAAGLDTDPLYCIFTSGSTGVPKGVLVSHRSVIDMAEQFTATFGFEDDTVFGNQAPFDFDVSVKDIYLTLRCGGQLHVLEKQLFMMPKKLLERLNTSGVNTIIWAASAMKIISALKTFDRIVPEHLRRVMFSGEALPCKVLNDWMDHLPQTQFTNLYGPTEITCNCTYYPVTRRFANEEALPIGRPFPNCDVFLLDRDAPVTAPGAPGELCVRGTCLALGYYANPERTASAFCQNPLQPHYPERIYRTGDLASWDEAGCLHFLGRSDAQVKHMGHRIELGEVEIAANAVDFITSACCLYDQRREKLCLFYQAETQDDKAVFARLRELVPDYMVPNRMIYLEKLPENRTGKIDRAALREIYFS